MEISDGWATEYNRKRGGVTLEESDWRDLLIDAGIPPETHVPLEGKFTLLRLQAAVFSLQALADYLFSNPDAGDRSAVQLELDKKKQELTSWLKALRETYEARRRQDIPA